MSKAFQTIKYTVTDDGKIVATRGSVIDAIRDLPELGNFGIPSGMPGGLSSAQARQIMDIECTMSRLYRAHIVNARSRHVRLKAERRELARGHVVISYALWVARRRALPFLGMYAALNISTRASSGSPFFPRANTP